MCPQTPEAIRHEWPGEQQTRGTAELPLTAPVLQQSRNSMAGSCAKQTQLTALLSKPLTWKISQKINKKQEDRGLSFVLREPAPAPASSHRNISLLQQGHLSLAILRAGTEEGLDCPSNSCITPVTAVLPAPK